jgi:hypothetical protein
MLSIFLFFVLVASCGAGSGNLYHAASAATTTPQPVPNPHITPLHAPSPLPAASPTVIFIVPALGRSGAVTGRASNLPGKVSDFKAVLLVSQVCVLLSWEVKLS